MTRFLSEALMATEPGFRLSLTQLERSHGKPSNDIRLTGAVCQAARAQTVELGLDPQDSTGKELYQALMERVRQDDKAVTRTLRTAAAHHVSAEADLIDGMAHVLEQEARQLRVFAVKGACFKAMIKKQPPKKAMKALGYRSLDSFLKHESPAAILTAAQLTESETWMKQLRAAYKRARPADVEARTAQIFHPSGPKWQALAEGSVVISRHNVIGLCELGAVVLLPLPKQVPDGAATASLCLAIRALADICSASSYLKASLARADFGLLLQQAADGLIYVNAGMLDRSVPWHLLQRYFTRLEHRFRGELFEPHLEAADMQQLDAHELIERVEPRLAFWRKGSAVAVVHDRAPVSFNLLDAALNLCNRLPYERRLVQYFQESLWHELMLGYLKHETVESSVLAQLQPQLALEPAK